MPSRIKLVLAKEFEFTSPKADDQIMIVPNMLDALRKLKVIVEAAGGHFSINSLHRTWTEQQHFVDLHTQDPIHHAYAAPPGGSFHMGGRACDFNIKGLNFPNVPREQWLQKFWDMYKPLGFIPIISKPDMDASEAWHMEYRDEWSDVCKNLSNGIGAKASILDIDNWNPKEDTTKVKRMFIQAQLLRLGRYEIKDIDGVFGSLTMKALGDLDLDPLSLDGIVDKVKGL